MRTFIQLRDGIGWATLVVPTGLEPDHSVTPDHTTAIEVFTDNADQFIGKKYNSETNSWVEAPKLKYAVVGPNGFILELRETIFEYETELPNHHDWDETIPPNWKWDGTEWIDPAPAGPLHDMEALQAEAERRAAEAEAEAEARHTH